MLMGRLNHVPTSRALLRLWSAEDRAIALSALEMFGIADLASKRADQLSGGQQQRVAIARALVQEPQVLLADEPIASLDPRNTKIVMDALLRINRHFGITVLCNLHSLDLARGYCDRLVGMSAGRVVFDGVPSALTDDVARELYGLEAGEVMDGAHALPPPRGRAPHTDPPRSRERAVNENNRSPPVPRGEIQCSTVVPSSRPPRPPSCSPVPSPAAAAEGWKDQYPSLDLAVIPAENASTTTDRYGPLTEYLAKELAFPSSCASPTTTPR